MRVWVLTILLVGCKPHVTLVPPPPNASPDERVAAFERLAAVSEKMTITTSCRTMGGCSETVELTLNLANGTQVHHAEDLLPMVPPDSETAQAVHASHRASRRTWMWAGLAAGALVAGFVVFDATDNEKLAFAVGGGGIVVGALMAWRSTNEETHQIRRANETYNDGLARTLRVCVDGYIVEACDTPHVNASR